MEQIKNQLILATMFFAQEGGGNKAAFFKEVYGDREFTIRWSSDNTDKEIENIWGEMQALVLSKNTIVTFLTYKSGDQTRISAFISWDNPTFGGSSHVPFEEDGCYYLRPLLLEHLSGCGYEDNSYGDGIEKAYEFMLGEKLIINDGFSKARAIASLAEKMHLNYMDKNKCETPFTDFLCVEDKNKNYFS